MFCRINSWRWLYSWRIQAEDNSQDTPDGSDIDLFSGIYNTVVTISEQEDTRCVDCEIYQPLVLQEKTQHWKKTQDKKKVSSEHSFVLYLLNKTIKQILFEAGTMKKCKYCKYLGGQLWVKSQAWAVFILIQCHSGVDKRVFVLPRASMALTGAFSKWRSMSLGTVRGLTSPFCLLQIKQRADGLVKKQLKTKAQHLQPNVKFL